MRSLLDIDDCTPEEIAHILDLSTRADHGTPLAGAGVALVFEKPSARTRSSSEMAVVELGGHPVFIQGQEAGIDSRESAEDVARTLRCFHRVICARVKDHGVLVRMAEVGAPVVNLLSDRAHPCQAFADLLTLSEQRANLVGMVLTYVGDANNVSRSLAKAALAVGMEFRLAAPDGYQLPAEEIAALRRWAEPTGGVFSVTDDPQSAAEGADALYTDVWTSMGQEDEAEQRKRDFAGYSLDEALVAHAAPHAIVLHCLPAHRGEEIAASVIDGPQSRVWRQAANRKTAMRGILQWAIA